MSMAEVHTGLVAAVLAAIGPIPIQRENAKFDKPTNAKWAAVHFLPNTPSGETLGDAGQDLATGIVQVDFYYPAGAGDQEADADLESFRAEFKAGHGVTYNGQPVIFKPVGAPYRRLEDNWFRVSVTVPWYALVPR